MTCHLLNANQLPDLTMIYYQLDAKELMKLVKFYISFKFSLKKMQWLAAWQHQAIIWTNVELTSHVFCGIHLRAISQAVCMKLISNMCLEITLLRPLPHPRGPMS